MKIFKTEKSAHAAMKRQGLSDMNYTIENHCSAHGTGKVVHIFVHDMADLHDAVARGFTATIDSKQAS